MTSATVDHRAGGGGGAGAEVDRRRRAARRAPRAGRDSAATSELLWGRCRGSGAEPYETIVDHVEVAWRCTCPSRKLPCKHALALLLLWVRGGCARGRPPGRCGGVDRRQRPSRQAGASSSSGTPAPAPDRRRPGDQPGAGVPDSDPAPMPDRGELDGSRDERVARMLRGPGRARPVARGSDARRARRSSAGALRHVGRARGASGRCPRRRPRQPRAASRRARRRSARLARRSARRAGHVAPDRPGGTPFAGTPRQRWPTPSPRLRAGRCATRTCWPSVPETDDWMVLGRSDIREDRIEVRRLWLRGERTQRWAMLLSFAAYRQALDTSWQVGTVVEADLHRYPGDSLRCLAGRRTPTHFRCRSIAAASDRRAVRRGRIGGRRANHGSSTSRSPCAPRPRPTARRWVFTDDSGSLPILAGTVPIGAVVAASEGAPMTVTVEWTPHGVLPLTVHLADRTIDVGPRADLSFVSVA